MNTYLTREQLATFLTMVLHKIRFTVWADSHSYVQGSAALLACEPPVDIKFGTTMGTKFSICHNSVSFAFISMGVMFILFFV